MDPNSYPAMTTEILAESRIVKCYPLIAPDLLGADGEPGKIMSLTGTG
jgi:hypothetical protein